MARASTALAEKRIIIHHGSTQNVNVLHTQKINNTFRPIKKTGIQKSNQKEKLCICKISGNGDRVDIHQTDCHISTRVLEHNREARLENQCSAVVVPKHMVSNLAKPKP
jgi:hypothetical protein